ncbi:insulin-like growth factor-binding protein complex acid labile subunit [Agrilus planipennis]|uniref:Insulin-like growth factor-binding protein complex acid labile subunit n=1 Tax=Agrilus planipennis TaxID=224129 RepID=A0A1W4WJL7_AGRPL|nr:insulin-like growth factor-binding protein complex acid labile subunit [Agrilus planipennis]
MQAILILTSCFISVCFGAECVFNNNKKSYFCTGITDKFPNKYYGNYHLKCVGCNIPIFKPDTFPENGGLTSLNISESGIQKIEPMAFSSLPTLSYLYLQNNIIQSVLPDAFFGLRELYELHLEDNHLNQLQRHFLNGFESVTVYLNNNQLKEIPPRVFEGIFSVLALNLSHNNIGILHVDSFQYLSMLEVLDMNNNNLCYIPLGAFQHLLNLKDLDLSHNKLTAFSYGELSGLRSVVSFNLGYNEFQEIGESTIHAFASLTNLAHLDLSGISGPLFLDTYSVVTYVPTLKSLTLNDNLWDCQTLAYTIQYLKTKNIDPFLKSPRHYDVSNINGIACSLAKVTEKLSFPKFLERAKWVVNKTTRYC